ncbi:MAG: bifunctional histidinol-phosphatase/imidazoleglycerol-phosphate dehydratase HisB [Deltaproteobacteria bacterium]|nr:bifunctional histidinol-phosphatase/imidazoleglycerol-phosphate dehydratase HisB [Deltaproteobacteria bacterium]
MGVRKILFVDRDGTLIRETADYQVDSLEKMQLVDNVIPALLQLRDYGYKFVIVTNQDGLGTEKYPQAAFDLVQKTMIELFRSQGIKFNEVLVCPHFPEDDCLCRKPHLGLVRSYLTGGDLDMTTCAMVGDRETDLTFAENMGIRGYRVGSDIPDALNWLEIAHELITRPRRGRCQRRTNETRIDITVELDQDTSSAPAPPQQNISTGIGFFDHMLDQLSRHGGFSLSLVAEGDLHVDEHHTIEDVALALGEALRQAIGDKIGIGRYGFVLPMDESLAQATIDLSGRAYFVLNGKLPCEQVGGMSSSMVEHFFQSFATALGATLHLTISGNNIHHMIEGLFKAVGRALRPALRRFDTGLPSTKGIL